MLNQISIQGRFTRDPELRHTPNSVPVASFTLACERDIKDSQTGERGCDFIDVVVWRHTAEFVSKYFFKGNMAVATGRLQLRDWTDKQGNKRRSAEVVADNVYFCESKKDSDNTYTSGSSVSSGSYGSAVPEYTQIDMDDGDLPF